jgi:UDP-2,4-diacetamido-2,4,6-trideoxy-beta-L-altropyranose hydrolase
LLPAPADYGQSADGPDNYAAWLGVSEAQDASDTLAALRDWQPDWMIADHYGIGQVWQQMLRSKVDFIMMIDDLANRRHDCDLLLDQNYYADLCVRYDGLVPSQCRLLLGPRHALLRSEFIEARHQLRERTGEVCSVLVFYGGFDRTNETSKALTAVAELGRPDLAVHVVVGAGNPNKRVIYDVCRRRPGFTYHEQIKNMAELMAAADISLGGGGTTTWERCLLGLPTITTELADNQSVMLRDLSAQGAIWHLGPWSKVTVDTLAARLDEVIQKPESVRAVTEKCVALMSGLADSNPHPAVAAMKRAQGITS